MHKQQSHGGKEREWEREEGYGYAANLLTIEVGSWGFLHCSSFNSLYRLVQPSKCEQVALKQASLGLVCKSCTGCGASKTGKWQRSSPEHMFTSELTLSPLSLICNIWPLSFVFVDLTLYCAVLCSNILKVVETHKKHVPLFILCDVLGFPYLGLTVTCLVKKRRERR